MSDETEKILIEILSKLHTINNLPVNIDYDNGCQEGLRIARHIIKEKLLENK